MDIAVPEFLKEKNNKIAQMKNLVVAKMFFVPL